MVVDSAEASCVRTVPGAPALLRRSGRAALPSFAVIGHFAHARYPRSSNPGRFATTARPNPRNPGTLRRLPRAQGSLRPATGSWTIIGPALTKL